MQQLYLLSEYSDTESRDERCAAAVLLPSGVCDVDNSVQLDVEGSSALRITVSWPGPLTDTCIMLRNFLDGVDVVKIDRSDPMIGRFHDALREIQPERKGVRESVARIKLPFEIKPGSVRIDVQVVGI